MISKSEMMGIIATEVREASSPAPAGSAVCSLCGHGVIGEIRTVRAFETYHQDGDTYLAVRCVDRFACLARRLPNAPRSATGANEEGAKQHE